ncbi:type II toxin-antitoxin system RelE/ParE family toxin [Serratia sp. AKBS12]|uniref:type II toxin-antitoxin system RelE/ParE family toxin n=1 Tax=Serratia sp. AKBS12 TaxID=2974597 RepID=UPI0021660208|nr:type II toxin-antitoxin system RelE/ParE family toxin [Serratia sp. AKBS12]MCS3409927.1 type II toxin-antitoxin system RelE/ParE family toxin [Serratia sp. AKBS12]
MFSVSLRFLAEKDGHAAKRAVAAIRHGVAVLARQSQLGRPLTTLDAEFREWPIVFGNSGYSALYHFDGRNAVLLAVRHQGKAGHSAPVSHKIHR